MQLLVLALVGERLFADIVDRGFAVLTEQRVREQVAGIAVAGAVKEHREDVSTILDEVSNAVISHRSMLAAVPARVVARRAKWPSDTGQHVWFRPMQPTTTTPHTIAFTDGACHGNPGPGGWGAVLRFGEAETQLYGGERHTTNNRMELLAAIVALEAITVAHPVVLWTDSKYVCTGITSWISGWKRKGWRTAAGQPVKNEDLWRRLDSAAAELRVEWKWVKGHAGHEGNELADALATRGAIEFGGSSGARPAPTRSGRPQVRRR